MKKFIMILSIAVMAAAVWFGLQNRDFLENTKTELGDVKAEDRKVTNELGIKEEEKKASEIAETQAKDKRNQASADIEGVKGELKIVTKSVDDASGDLKTVEIKQKEIDLLIKKVFPDGKVTTAEEMRTQLAMLKDALTEKQNVVAELEAQYVKANQAKQVKVAAVKKEEKYQVERGQKLALNGMVATVIAVNKEWGFVMVNAGRAHGVGGESSLLVKRGNSRVARLRIVNLQDTVSVCDVVKDSLIKGIKIQAGDKVIFENPGG